jgi:hypothetical protein
MPVNYTFLGAKIEEVERLFCSPRGVVVEFTPLVQER